MGPIDNIDKPVYEQMNHIEFVNMLLDQVNIILKADPENMYDTTDFEFFAFNGFNGYIRAIHEIMHHYVLAGFLSSFDSAKEISLIILVLLVFLVS